MKNELEGVGRLTQEAAYLLTVFEASRRLFSACKNVGSRGDPVERRDFGEDNQRPSVLGEAAGQ